MRRVTRMSTVDDALADCQRRRQMARKLGDDFNEQRLTELLDMFLERKFEEMTAAAAGSPR